MYGFQRQYYRPNHQAIQRAIEKINQNTLTIEDILDEEDLVNDLKQTNYSQLISHLGNEFIGKLLDYITKIPAVDEQKVGYKFPFVSCEILTSENSHIIDSFFEERHIEEERSILEGGQPTEKEFKDSQENSDKEVGFEGEQEKKNSEILFEDQNQEKINEAIHSEIEAINDNKVEFSINTTKNIVEGEKVEVENGENKEVVVEVKVGISQSEESPVEKEVEIVNIQQDVVVDNAQQPQEASLESNGQNQEVIVENSQQPQEATSEQIEDIIQQIDQPKENLVADSGVVKSQEKTEITPETKEELEEKIEREEIIHEIEEKKCEKDYNEITKAFNPEIYYDNDNGLFGSNSENNGKENKISPKKSLQPKIKYDLLDKLFDFLNEEGELNYVLAGYFSKLFGHLLSHKPSVIMKYIFVLNPHVVDHMVRHINRKSINESLLKIVLSPNCEILNNDFKTNLIIKILNKFKPVNREETINITEFFLELLMNKNTHSLILKSEQILNILHQVVQENISDNSVNKDLIKILVKLNEVLLKELSGNATVLPILSSYDSNFSMPNFNIDDDNCKNELDLPNNEIIFKTLYNTFTLVVDDFFKEEHDTQLLVNSIGQETKRLGVKKIAQLDYIRDMIEIIINAESISLSNQYLNEIVEKICNSGLFKKIIEYLTEFPWNNMFQRSFEQLVNLILNKYTNKKLVNNFFYESDFFNSILTSILEPKVRYLSGKEINNGLFALYCEISYSITKSENAFLNESLTHENFWKNFIEKLIIPIKEKFSKGMQFNQENPFSNSTPMSNENTYNNRESFNELFKSCKDDLLGRKQCEAESREEEAQDEKAVSDFSDDSSNIEHSKVMVYDNNYWKKDINEVDFEIL